MGLSLLSCGAGLVALSSLGGPAEARTDVTFARTQSGQQTTVPAAHVFGSDAGMVLNFIKPDRLRISKPRTNAGTAGPELESLSRRWAVR